MTAQFPGLVARQELINFCRARVAEMTKQSDEYLDMLNKVGDKISNEDAMALNDAYYRNLGEQAAYRKITDWVSENLAEVDNILDMLDLEIDEEEDSLNV